MRLRTVWKLEFSLIVADVERFRKKWHRKEQVWKIIFSLLAKRSFLLVSNSRKNKVDMFTLNGPSLYSSKQSHIPLFILTRILILMIGPYEQTH